MREAAMVKLEIDERGEGSGCRCVSLSLPMAMAAIYLGQCPEVAGTMGDLAEFKALYGGHTTVNRALAMRRRAA